MNGGLLVNNRACVFACFICAKKMRFTIKLKQKQKRKKDHSPIHCLFCRNHLTSLNDQF